MFKVSIIIPIYNVAQYIIECLESVYNQTYKNIEVILVDDCSTDNSMEIISEYLTFDKLSNTKVIHHTHNRGISAARNTGIIYAEGEYIFFLDSDDLLRLDSIESFILLAIKYNFPDCIYGSASPLDNNRTLACITLKHLDIPEYSSNITYIRKICYRRNFLPITVWNKLIKRKFIINNCIYFKEGIIYEDILWCFLLSNKLKTIAFNKKSTYMYRYVPNSITNKKYDIINKDSEVIITKEFFNNINYKYFFPQLIYTIHFNHSAYCRRYGNKPLPPSYIRYPKAFIFFLKCLFIKPEHLRNI